MKIFVGTNDIAGFQSRAARALARAGHQVHYLNASPHPYNPELPPGSSVVAVWPGGFQLASRLRGRRGVSRMAGSLLRNILLWAVLLRSLPRTDAYLFAGRRTFFSACADLRLLKLFRKRVVHVFLGSDSRPAYLGSVDGGEIERRITPRRIERLARRVRRQRRRLRVIAACVSEIVENPLCAQFHERPCINWFRIGFPLSAEVFGVEARLRDAAGQPPSGSVRILHCPSKLGRKGTGEIEKCIERLQGEGIRIEYVRITGMPHREVLDQIAHCDFVVDQLYSDTPLAGFASEAAIFGKPAVVGGYGWMVLEDDRTTGELPPSARCEAETLEEVVRGLIERPAERRQLGERARAFVRSVWSEDSFATRMTMVMEGQTPDSWIFDPREVVYVGGCGMETKERRELLRVYLDRMGSKALGLEARPDLREAIEAFAREKEADRVGP